jgi:Ca-activated chloride channel family protein
MGTTRAYVGIARRVRALGLMSALAFFFVANAQDVGGDVHVALVLDASGSMYNRLDDGRYRIDAAKSVLQGLVSGLPADDRLNVGLRVYGARLLALDDGACQDSHLEVPVDGLRRDALLGVLDATVARGATPIVHSLALTVDDLPPAGDRRVVLVTDGLESCGGDLDAVAERYRTLGIDLRIVGLDLDADAAAAFEDVAAFANAASAVELGLALDEAVGVADTASTVAVEARVTRDGVPTSEGATIAFVDPVTGQRVRLEPIGPGRYGAALEPGTYAAELIDAFADDRTAVITGLVVAPDDEPVFTFELAPEVEVALEVDPAEPMAGTSVTVDYGGGPDDASGLVVLAPAGAADATRLDLAYVSGGSGSLALATPDVPGTFEARYLLDLPEGGYRVVGRSASFATAAATAVLRAPAQVPAGTTFEVDWEGPAGAGDRIEIHRAGVSASAAVGSVRTFTRPAALRAPAATGAYELRYVTGGSGSVLATAALEVIEAVVTLDVPTEVSAGSIVTVGVSGAVGPRDAIVLVRAGAPDEGAERIGPPQRIYGASVGFRAPDEPGAYEVRYIAGADGRIAQRVALSVR